MGINAEGVLMSVPTSSEGTIQNTTLPLKDTNLVYWHKIIKIFEGQE